MSDYCPATTPPGGAHDDLVGLNAVEVSLEPQGILYGDAPEHPVVMLLCQRCHLVHWEPA